MTLVELIENTDRKQTFVELVDIFNQIFIDKARTLKDVTKKYGKVLEELLLYKGKKINKDFSFIVIRAMDDYESEYYYDVSLFNHKHEKPPENLSPWYGISGEVIPEGHYNANSEKYHQFLGVGFDDWEELANYEIINDANLPPAELLANILYEITFYGVTQEARDQIKNTIHADVENAKNELANGE